MLQLSIQDYEGKSTVIPLTDGELSIGREDSNAICLTERNVSRRHARIVTQDGHVYLESIAATYGTRLNNTLLRERTELASGDVVQIGDYSLEILGAGQVKRDTALVDDQAAAAAPAAPPKKTADNATAIVNLADIQQAIGGDSGDAASIPAAEQPRLVVVSDNLKGWEGRVTRSPTVIGRVGDNADLVVDHRSISKEHARLTRKADGTWEILDLGSANGIQVNGEPYSKVSIRSGDTLVLGHVTLQFLAAGERASAAGAAAPGKSGGNKGILIALVALLVLLAGAALAFVVLGGDSGEAAGTVAGSDEGDKHAKGDDGDKGDDSDKADKGDSPGEAASGAAKRAAVGDVIRKVSKLEKAGMLSEARAFAEDALKKQPGNAELGLLVKRLEAEQKVGARIEAAEKKLSKDPKAVFNAMTDLEADAKASPALTKRVAALKAKAQSLVVAGLAVEAEKLLSRRRYSAARDKAEMCLELDPNNKTCAEVMVKAKGKAKARPSRAPRRERAVERPAAKPVAKAPEKPAAKAPEKPAPKAAEMSAKEYYRAGRKMALNDKGKAAALFEKAAAKGYKRAHGKLARLYYQLGKMSKCAYHGKQYVNRYPDAGDAQQIEGLVEKCK